MSKTITEEIREKQETIEYFEAEVESLKEELPTALSKRRAFVNLRISRLEKELVALRKSASSLKEHADWLDRVNPKA